MSPTRGMVWIHPETKATLLSLNPTDKTMFVFVGAASVQDAALLRMALDEAVRVAAGHDQPQPEKGGDPLCLN